MYYLLVLISTVLFCYGIIKFVRNPFFLFATAAVSQLDTIFDKSLEEEEKERLLLKKVKVLLTYMGKFLLLLLSILIVSFSPVYAYSLLVENAIVDNSSIYFYLAMTVGSFSILLFGKEKSDYSYWIKLLHFIVLDNYNLAKSLFKKEKKITTKKGFTTNQEFTIVTGLARGGTTALTNILFDSGKFHSLSYANMPMIIAPKLWAKIYKPKNKKIKERAHGDNVLFSENSIEALEEYFFKVWLKDEYIKEETLVNHELEEAIYEAYLTYQSFFKESNETTYLAKNNNFILRYESLRKINKKFRVVLLFRSPVDHAFSLMKQHENFSEQQRKDPFVKDYMNWLAHHEFGLNQKSFDFGYERMYENYSKDTLNYWLGTWINYYSYILSLEESENLLLVDYEDLLFHPNELKSKLGEHLNIYLEPDEALFQKKNKGGKDSLLFDKKLMDKANQIYSALRELRIDCI